MPGGDRVDRVEIHRLDQMRIKARVARAAAIAILPVAGDGNQADATSPGIARNRAASS